jgi:hypothetical protein
LIDDAYKSAFRAKNTPFYENKIKDSILKGDYIMMVKTMMELMILALVCLAIYVNNKQDEKKQKEFMEFGMEQA